jgi:hypothetical protein
MSKKFQLSGLPTQKALKIPDDARRVPTVELAKVTLEAKSVFEALTATAGAKELIKQTPSLGDFKAWSLTACFCVCIRTGTAKWVDIWDCDHFDGFTHMQQNVAECRAWFSANGYSFWGSGETKTGRVNCYFNAPSAGDYICNAELQSFGGPTQVECLIDSSSFGILPFNGVIVQSHHCNLAAGGHSFRIRQVAGSFFWLGLTVWKV